MGGEGEEMWLLGKEERVKDKTGASSLWEQESIRKSFS